MIEQLKDWDRQLFLFINSRHNAFWDVIMYWASDKFIWFPFYLFLLIVLIRYYKKKSFIPVIYVAATITASDQIASGLIKNSVKRLRPSHEPSLEHFVHLSTAGAGGLYGFVSSHASNSFGLFVFLSCLLPAAYRPLKYVLFFWALLVSYSRIYNGVHYPGDVFVAALIGSGLGWLFAEMCTYTLNRINKNGMVKQG